MIGTDECRCDRLPEKDQPCYGCAWKAAAPTVSCSCGESVRFVRGEWRDVFGSQSDRNGHRHDGPKPWPEFTAYSVGLVSASVCTRLTDAEAEGRLNVEHWTGMDPPACWTVAADPTFHDGQPNPHPCPDDPRNRHVLFHC